MLRSPQSVKLECMSSDRTAANLIDEISNNDIAD